jgi:hypothetical protein
MPTILRSGPECFPGWPNRAGEQPADLVVLNGKIVTVNPQSLILEAAAVREGRFVAAAHVEVEIIAAHSCDAAKWGVAVHLRSATSHLGVFGRRSRTASRENKGGFWCTHSFSPKPATRSSEQDIRGAHTSRAARIVQW